MKMFLIALLVACPIAARAASPEDSYIAARDKYIAKFKIDGVPDDKTTRDESAARADLEAKLRAILGRVTIEGVPAEGNSNLETLIGGDMGLGLLDALVHQSADGAPRLLVTTPTLEIGRAHV